MELEQIRMWAANQANSWMLALRIDGATTDDLERCTERLMRFVASGSFTDAPPADVTKTWT